MLNAAHSGCKPCSSMSSFTHSLQVFLCLPLLFCPPPPHFFKLTPNHLHSFVRNAQTISIYHASPPQPHSAHPKDCAYKTSLCFLSFRGTPQLVRWMCGVHTSTSPAYALLSPGYADFQPSLLMFLSHMSTNSGHRGNRP